MMLVPYCQERTVCLKGHTIQELPWLYDENDARYKALKETMCKELENAIRFGYYYFECSMELGFDLICAEILLNLKKKYPYIKIVGALRGEDQDKDWECKDRFHYQRLLSRLDKTRSVYYAFPEDYPLERNRFMINESSMMIALFNGASEEMKSIIDYARAQGLRIVIIKP